MFYPLIYWRTPGLIPYLVIVSNAAVNIGVLMFFQINVLDSFGCIPELGSQTQKADPFSFFEVSPYCFPQCLHQSTFPPTGQKGSPFSLSSPALVVYWFIGDSHFDRCEMVSHCSFNLHFSDDYWCWDLFLCLLAICMSSLMKYIYKKIFHKVHFLSRISNLKSPDEVNVTTDVKMNLHFMQPWSA